MRNARKEKTKYEKKDKRITAYHEAGHAVSAFYLENCEPVYEISIIPLSDIIHMIIF